MDASPSSDELLQGFLADPEEAVIGFRLDGFVFLWNLAAETLYGYSAGEILGKSPVCLLGAREAAAFADLLSHPVREIAAARPGVDRVHKSGARVSVSLTRILLRNAQGEPLGFVERARKFSREPDQAGADTHLRFLVEKLPIYLWTTDRRLQVTSRWGSNARPASAFLSNSVGQSVQEFLRVAEASDSPVKEHFLALRGQSSRFEYVAQNRLYDVSIEPYFDAQRKVIGCVGMALDITERRKSEDEIRYRATHDGLTELVNYREFVDSLEREIRRSGRTGQRFAVLLLDLDDLKLINDRFGHLTGNLALKRLARIMKEHCRGTEVAARFGGDEFAILLLDADAERAQTVAGRIRTCLRTHPDAPQLSVSLGLSVYPEDGGGAADLLEAADKRLYQDKKSRSNRAASHAEHGG